MGNLRSHIAAAVCTVALLLAGCGESSPTDPGDGGVNQPDKATFNVTWDSSAVVFTAAEAASDLEQIDSASFRFHFDAGSSKAKDLRKGSILVVNDYAIRKVTSVSTSGGRIVVETEDVGLTEAMVDADIEWDQGVDVSAKMLADGFGKQMGANVVTYKDSAVISFAWGKYEVEATVKGKSGETAVEIKLLREAVGGSGAKSAHYILAGTIKKFRNTGHIKIRGRQLQEFTMDNNNIVADFTMTAVAAGLGNDLGIEIPIPLLKYPLPQLPFFVFEIKALGVVNAVVPTDGSCDIGVRMQYVSNQGFQWDPQVKNLLPRSDVQQWKGFKPTRDPKTAASGPVGVSAGIAFPRLEVGIVGTKTNAWVQTAGLVGGDFTVFPVCRRAQASVIVAAGANIGLDVGPVLGVKKLLWQRDTMLFKSAGCP